MMLLAELLYVVAIDFITMLVQEAFEPNYGLFSSTKLNSFYPSATSSIHGRYHIQLFEFIGKVEK